VSLGVVFAFAPIDDRARTIRECALERVLRWRRLARHARTDRRSLDRPERDAGSYIAPIRLSHDDARTVELAVRQAEHAADGLE
jgi:hypothetical protein